MSIITDALKKKEKEVGQEEVQAIVPVSLDAPDVTIPKDRSVRRVAGLGGIFLIVAGVAISAVILYNEFRGGTATEEAMAQVASSPKPERGTAPLEQAPEEALPLPKPDPSVMPAAVGSEATKTPAPEVGPPAPVEETPAETGVDPTLEVPSTVTEGPNAPAEAPIEPLPDPFAGIALQGIIRFDPTSPEALINGKSLKVGDSINGVVVVEISEESVKLRCGNIERVISYE